MSAPKKKPDFFITDEGLEFIEALRAMTTDKAYNTKSTFSANTELYPDNLIPFVNKHTEYLRSHPSTDPYQYLSNLRLMTRIRSSLSSR